MKYQIGDNTYTVNLDDNESVKNALVSEIKYQHEIYGINNDKTIHISVWDGPKEAQPEAGVIATNPATAKRLVYYINYDVYLTDRAIGAQKPDSTVENMNELVKKVIKKCEQKRESNLKKAKISNDFKRFIESTFERNAQSIEFEDKWNQTVVAKITNRDGMVITVHQDYSIVLPLTTDEHGVTELIQRLLA
jgi:hypothetical protein